MNRREQKPTFARAFITDLPDGPDEDTRRLSSEPPLPPLPDGGLGASMPAWLRDPSPLTALPTESMPETPAPDLTDTTAFLSEDDLPEWLRRLAASLPRDAEGSSESSPTVPFPPTLGLQGDEDAFALEPLKRTTPRNEEAPPDERPGESRTLTALTPGTATVSDQVEPPMQVSQPMAVTLASDADEVPVQKVGQLAPDSPGWRWLLLALVLAVLAVAVVVYLVTST